MYIESWNQKSEISSQIMYRLVVPKMKLLQKNKTNLFHIPYIPKKYYIFECPYFTDIRKIFLHDRSKETSIEIDLTSISRSGRSYIMYIMYLQLYIF